MDKVKGFAQSKAGLALLLGLLSTASAVATAANVPYVADVARALASLLGAL